jgi:hypothetical protein
MSRSQMGQVYSTASGQQATNEAAAQTARTQEQQGISGYQSQLAKYAGENPYVQGGEYQTAQNQALSQTAGGIGEAAKAAGQAQARRTGQNAAAGVAGGEAAAQDAAREMMKAQGEAGTERIGGEAGYNKSVLAGYGEVPGMEATLASGAQQAAGGELSAEEEAAKQPSFMDQMGQMLIQNEEDASKAASQAAVAG